MIVSKVTCSCTYSVLSETLNPTTVYYTSLAYKIFTIYFFYYFFIYLLLIYPCKLISVQPPRNTRSSSDMSRLYHSVEWYTTRNYGITYSFHDRHARANTGLRTAR